MADSDNWKVGNFPFTASGYNVSPSKTYNLESVNQKFMNLENELQLHIQRKKNSEDERLQKLQSEFKEALNLLDKNLQNEIKTRQDSQRALQSIFDSEVNRVVQGLEVTFKERNDSMVLALELLNQRVVTLEKELEEKNDKIKDISEKYNQLEKQISTIKSSKKADNLEQFVRDEMNIVRQSVRREQQLREEQEVNISKTVEHLMNTIQLLVNTNQ